MNEIWKVIAEIGVELHPDTVEVIASKIAILDSVDHFDNMESGLGLGSENVSIDRLGMAWKKMPKLSPLELAAALRAASGTASMIEKRESVEMVWTGPFTGLVPSRHTEQVLLEVISSAKQRVRLMSFVVYDIDTVIKALQDAIAKSVRVDIFLEPSKEQGGKVDVDAVQLFSERIPSANLYVWNDKKKDNRNGAVHAKCAVADGSIAFITSANLTNAAMEHNMELGVLVRGGNLPETLDRHLEALVTTGIVERV